MISVFDTCAVKTMTFFKKTEDVPEEYRPFMWFVARCTPTNLLHNESNDGRE